VKGSEAGEKLALHNLKKIDRCSKSERRKPEGVNRGWGKERWDFKSSNVGWTYQIKVIARGGENKKGREGRENEDSAL